MVSLIKAGFVQLHGTSEDWYGTDSPGSSASPPCQIPWFFSTSALQHSTNRLPRFFPRQIHTSFAGVVHQDDLLDQGAGGAVDDGPERPQQRRPRLVVEDDDDAGRRQQRRVFLRQTPGGGGAVR